MSFSFRQLTYSITTETVISQTSRMEQFFSNPYVNYNGLPYAVKDMIYQQQRSVDVEKDGEMVSWRPVSKKLLYFSQVTGMPIVQINGQRFYGPPRNYTGPVPPRGSEIFVGGLPRDCDEMDIVPIFSSIGQIYRIRLMMDFSGTNRGYCYVQYFSSQIATQAIAKLNRFEIRLGKQIGVFRSFDNTRLRLTGIPRDLGAETLFNEMSRLTSGLRYASLAPNAQAKGPAGQWAILEYNSHREAAMARRILIPRGFYIGHHYITVDWARPLTCIK